MKTHKFLLIGWDAADWKMITPLVESGRMPVVSRLIDTGVIADLATLQPVMSPLLWNSVATGKRADVHRVLGFTEVREGPNGHRVRPVSSTSRRAKALWNILSQSGLRTNVVGWFGSHPAEPISGVCVSDAFVRSFPAHPDAWPMMSGTVFPDRIAGALKDLRIHPEHIDAEIIRMFVPNLAECVASKPNRLSALRRILAECFSTHAAATWVMEHEKWDFMAVYYIGLDHFSHSFINFHPPRLPWIPEKEFEFYREVVNSGYRLMDLFLARLLELAGPDTRVMLLSDHGFHSDHLRPRAIPDVPAGPCTQHRDLGIFVLNGDGVRQDERIYGLNLLDIAPTVLSTFGLPAGEDMPGRVLSEAFEAVSNTERIPSWENIPGESGMHSADIAMEEEDADALLDQFVALGYIDEPSADRKKAAADCLRENDWNLVRVYMSTWRFGEALPLLENISSSAPERIDFALTLADCQRRIGLLEEAEATARRVIEEHRDTPTGQFVLGNIAFEQRRFKESLDHYTAARKADPERSDVLSRVGFALLKLRRWKEAARVFRDALKKDPSDPLSHQGLGLALLKQKKIEAAAKSLLTSVGLRHDMPQSHYWLGVCLASLGRQDRARQAFEMALSFQPPLLAAHRWLARLAENPDRAESHREAARAFFRLRRQQAARDEAVCQEARHRAIDRDLESLPATRERQPETSREAARELSLTLVSGLPRSGTSLMMQMLAAGGVPVMSDQYREPDSNNPEGYFEWEAIKGIARHPEILYQAEGKAIKIVSILLPSLPRGHRYKVIFMDRPVAEVFASQQKMIGTPLPGQVSPERTMELLESHRQNVLRMLTGARGFEVLVVNYPDLVQSPDKWIQRITDFIGGAPNPSAMGEVIRPALYRNRLS